MDTTDRDSEGSPVAPPDILAELAATTERPRGTPCRIAEMRRDRPDLALQWDRVIQAKRTGTTGRANETIANWFTDHDFVINRNTVDRHLRATTRCVWCDGGLTA